MRTILLALATGVLALAAARPVLGQVTDTERAAARELFKEGDGLQRAGRFAEALDKFQRAQQVYGAPTNLLRVAECEAALGRLVESAEGYREVMRTALPAGSPPAFQAAVDQAKAELAQVEPRVPKLVVQVQPAGVVGPQMQIDGRNVPGALIGAQVPLDPGPHKVFVLAPGYASAEQEVVLADRDTKTVVLTLAPTAGTAAAPPPPTGTEGTTPPGTPPPPPPIVTPDLPSPQRSRTGILLGVHLGAEVPGGKIIRLNATQSTDLSEVTSGGLALGLDAGLRVARQGYLGLTLDHAELGAGSQGHSSNTTLLALVVGLIVNPDRTSFYGELALGVRAFEYTTATNETAHYVSGELGLGAGVWIPVGRSFRLVPKISFGLGAYGPSSDPSSTPSTAASAGHAFTLLGLAGLFNRDL
jgi:hypothetical protein